MTGIEQNGKRPSVHPFWSFVHHGRGCFDLGFAVAYQAGCGWFVLGLGWWTLQAGWTGRGSS